MNFFLIAEKRARIPSVNQSSGVSNVQANLHLLSQLMEVLVPLHCPPMEVPVDPVLFQAPLDPFKTQTHSQPILFQQEIVILSLTLPLILMDLQLHQQSILLTPLTPMVPLLPPLLTLPLIHMVLQLPPPLIRPPTPMDPPLPPL